MPIDLSEKKSITGRSEKDIAKYGERGTAYIGKVVMSAGEKPVLGRKILMDISRPHVMLICGKRGGGKCVDPDTLITLEDGSLVKIKDLENDSRRIFSMGEDFKIKSKPRVDFFKRPVSKMLELTLRSGRKIKLTHEHPLFTINGWTPAQDLCEGSRIATPRKIEAFGNEFLRECEVKILAYLIAEGHIKNKLVWFSNTDEQIVEDFKLAVNDFAPNLVTNYSEKNNWRVVSKDNNNSLKNWLKEINYYDLSSHEKFIPDQVLRLPKSKLALFLNRLFSCDGSIYFESNRYRLSYSSVSEELIRQVQNLLLRFGVLSRIREKKAKLNGKIFPSFEIVIEGENVLTYLEEIGFYGQKELRQEQALTELREKKFNPNNDTIPKEIWDSYRPENWAFIGKEMGYSNPKSIRESIRYAPSRQKLLQIAKADQNELIEQLASSDIYWDEIKNIKELKGDFEVYDFCVPDSHNFIANDIIVHNSYTMSVVLEEFARQPLEFKKRLSVIVIDTVGIFWSLKVPGTLDKDTLTEWDLEPEKTSARVFVPKGRFDFYKEKELPVDGFFTLKTSELDITEWLAMFRLTWKDAEGILLTRVLEKVKDTFGTLFGIDEIVSAAIKDDEADELTKQALKNRLEVAKTWGLFEKEGTPINEIAKGGEITVIDVSSYRQAIGMQGTRDIIVALLGKKLFEERMLFRKEEEIQLMKGAGRKSGMPVVWMMIDEAHMFMPVDEDNIALPVLLEWVRVGRQPGLSLVLATQRPNRLHPDCISQCDYFFSMRMTAKPDIEAVSAMKPSYLHQSLEKYYADMPRAKGFALILDDNSEKLWLIKVRPRLSWDGGTTATAFTD